MPFGPSCGTFSLYHKPIFLNQLSFSETWNVGFIRPLTWFFFFILVRSNLRCSFGLQMERDVNQTSTFVSNLYNSLSESCIAGDWWIPSTQPWFLCNCMHPYCWLQTIFACHEHSKTNPTLFLRSFRAFTTPRCWFIKLFEHDIRWTT